MPDRKRVSLIIPAHNADATLPATLASVERAERVFGESVEKLVIEDVDGKGPSWARNRGLAEASGDYIFFCDADDCVGEGFFAEPFAALERTDADMCFFTYAGGPKLESGVIKGSEAVRARYLPAFFGYSNADVRRWNAGGSLSERKEMGQVWRCAYRRSFLERHQIRFDEAMTLFEDAAFLSNCVAYATKVVSLPRELYDYRPLPYGNLATGYRGRRNWDYKFLALAFRKRLNDACDGELWSYCEASCVFSALELLKARYRLREYLADPSVRKSLRTFPLSFRHPLTALAVIALRHISLV